MLANKLVHQFHLMVHSIGQIAGKLFRIPVEYRPELDVVPLVVPTMYFPKVY